MSPDSMPANYQPEGYGPPSGTELKARMIVAFTGTRAGLQPEQHNTLDRYFESLPDDTVLLHGGCVGADADAHESWLLLEREMEIFPQSKQPILVAPNLIGARRHKPCHDPLERNREMVQRATHLVACPAGPEIMRSGTWSTVRYARRLSLPITIIWPNGSVTQEAGR